MVNTKKSDVVFFEAFDEEQELLRKICPAHVKAEFTPLTIQEACLSKAPSRVISIRTQSKIPAAWKESLDGILTRSTGFDHIREYQKETKARTGLGYLPSYCSRAVAEQAVLMMLALMRKLAVQQQYFSHFHRNGLTGQECQDKKLLIVGVGNIGAEIVDIAHGLRMKVAGADIDHKLPSLEYIDLVPGLAWADVVMCTAALTDETKNMLNYDTLRRMKTGTIFINVARGEISPLKDLKRLMDEKILGGLGLDVYEDEHVIAHDLRADKQSAVSELASVALELSQRTNVIFTPHNAFNTREALARKADQAMESVVLFLAENKFPFPIPETQNS